MSKASTALLVRLEGEHALMALDQIVAELKKHVDVDYLLYVRDEAERRRAYMKQASDAVQGIAYYAEVKLRAERRITELLPERTDVREQRRQAGRASARARRARSRSASNGSPVGTRSRPGTSELTPQQVHRIRQVGDVPLPVFEEYIAESRRAGAAPSRQGLQRFARGRREEEAGPTAARPVLTAIGGSLRSCLDRIDEAAAEWQRAVADGRRAAAEEDALDEVAGLCVRAIERLTRLRASLRAASSGGDWER